MKWREGRSPYFLTVSSKSWNTVWAGQEAGPSFSMRMSTSPSARVVVYLGMMMAACVLLLSRVLLLLLLLSVPACCSSSYY